MTDRYVIAVKREERERAPDDLASALREVVGLSVEESSNPRRVQVEASPEAIEEARRRFGELCYIEPAIPHHRRV
jgi:hypothetical protein